MQSNEEGMFSMTVGGAGTTKERVRVVAKRTSIVNEEHCSASSKTDNSHHLNQVHVEIRKKTTNGDVPVTNTKTDSSGVAKSKSRSPPSIRPSEARRGSKGLAMSSNKRDSRGSSLGT